MVWWAPLGASSVRSEIFVETTQPTTPQAPSGRHLPADVAPTELWGSLGLGTPRAARSSAAQSGAIDALTAARSARAEWSQRDHSHHQSGLASPPRFQSNRPVSYLTAILLGFIEGLTEFLPVSSTGHLLIDDRWLGRQAVLFNYVIQSDA